MINTKKILIFIEFSLYLRIVNAFNSDNFGVKMYVVHVMYFGQ